MYERDFEDFGGPFRRSAAGPDFRGLDRKLAGFRASRGMMEPAILDALSEKPMHGYEIISHLEEKSHGMWRPSAGSIYPTLQLLEEKELVEHVEQSGKKTYQLTHEGKVEAEARREQLRAVFERFSDMDQLEGRRMNFMHGYQRQFHKQIGEIMKLMRQIFRKGSAGQKAAMDDAVEAFKTRLEIIAKGEQ